MRYRFRSVVTRGSLLGVALLGGSPGVAGAQDAASNGAVELSLSDGISVFVVPVADPDPDGVVAYDYLPGLLRLAEGGNGERQFLLSAASDDSAWVERGVEPVPSSSGVMHAIVDWRLTARELEEAERQLTIRCNGPGMTAVNRAADSVLARFRHVVDGTRGATVTDGFGVARPRTLRGLPILKGDIPCGEIRGPATILLPDGSKSARLLYGRNYADPDARISHGSITLLSGQRFSVAFDLHSSAAAALGSAYSVGRTSSSEPGGAWWMEISFGLDGYPSGQSIETSMSATRSSTATFDVKPWLRSLNQRWVLLWIDDDAREDLASSFGSVVEHVLLRLEKKHGDGTVARQAYFLDQMPIELPPFSYTWRGEEPGDWLRYRHRMSWYFTNGGTYDTGWVESDDSAVIVYLPYERRTVALFGDAATFRARNIEAVDVELSYQFFGESRQHLFRLDQKFDTVDHAEIDLTIPRGEFSYDYRITWHVTGQPSLTTSGTDQNGLIFIDKLPTAEDGE